MGFVDKQNTAILFFHRPAKVEGDIKTFQKNAGQKRDTQIAEEFNNHTLQQIRQSGLPYFIAHYHREQGHAFGRVLSKAIESVYELGYKKVIAIGNDCLELTAVKIKNAAVQIQKGQMVLGPTYDGGVYLIGVHRNNFDPEKFAALSWNSDQVQSDLTTYSVQQSCQVLWKKQLLDIDLPGQLDSWLSQHKISHQIAASISALLFHFISKNADQSASFVFPDILQEKQLRAPPA